MDNNRIEIIKMLKNKNLCACNILNNLNITQPTLSHHMKVLLDNDLVIKVKNGNCINYQLKKSTFEELKMFIDYITEKEKNMEEKDKTCNCSDNCTCGCQDGKECTCDNNCKCGDDCKCGCKEEKDQ